MATAVRAMECGFEGSPVETDELDVCGCLPREPNRPAAPPRLYTVRRDGLDAFAGPFEAAYTWAVTVGAGAVTLTSFAA